MGATAYYLVKYMSDPRRQEPRNVGVIVESDGSFASRFVGVDSATGDVDGRKIRPYDMNRNAFALWVEYISEQLSAGQLDKLLTFRERKPSSLWVELAGHEYTEIESLETFSGSLFNDLVASRASEPVETPMKDRIEHIFNAAQVAFSKRAQVEGAFGSQVDKIKLSFDYATSLDPLVAFDTIGATRGLGSTLELRSKIEAVQRLNSAANFGVFYSGADAGEHLDDYLRPVEERAQAIDVDHEATAIDTLIEFAQG